MASEKEFMMKNFGFSQTKPHLFALPQFGPNILYPIWTVFALVYHVGILAAYTIITIDKYGEPRVRALFFLFFTRWSYLLLAIYSLLDCITTLHLHCRAKHLLKQSTEDHDMPWYLKLNWALFTTSSVVGFIVTLVYWFVYALANIIAKGNWQEDEIFVDVWKFESITFHIFNAVMIFLHIIISAKPSRILHVYLPMLFFAIYAIFNAIYQVITDRFIYKPLDWDNTGAAIGAVVVGVLVLVPIVHMLVHGLIFVRTALNGERCPQKQQNGRVHPEPQQSKPNKDAAFKYTTQDDSKDDNQDANKDDPKDNTQNEPQAAIMETSEF